MADTLSEKLRQHAKWMAKTLDYMEVEIATVEEAAAELDRREAIVAAAEAWAKAAHANKRPGILMDEEIARNALLALIPEEPHD
jgi:hypothetical protein